MPDFGQPVGQLFGQPGWLWLLPVIALLAGFAVHREAATRQRLAHIARALLCAALVLGLSRPLTRDDASRADVVFALDVSRSIAPASIEAGLEFFERALQDKPADSAAGLVVFGADAAVEVLAQRRPPSVATISADVAVAATDIGAAIDLASGAFARAAQRRVVLLTDGRDNRGDARASAVAARALGVRLDTVALDRPGVTDEVHASDVVAPAQVAVHEPFELSMNVHSARAGPAELVVMRDGALLSQTRVELDAGANTFSLVEQVERAGLVEYELIINADADSVTENNRFGAFVRVTGPPRALYVGAEGAGPRQAATPVFASAMLAQGLDVDVVTANALPGSASAMADFDVVVLDNVPAFDLSVEKMGLLEDYVRNGGGGVIALGGPRSYSAGGYQATPLETLLPVSMDVPTTVEVPSVAVVFVLDKSGSMSGQARGQNKLELAKSAALTAAGMLSPRDQVGVLAFDSAPEWVLPPSEVADRQALAARLRELKSGGGTDLAGALAQAHEKMLEVSALVRHFIVLSDGLSDTKVDFAALSGRIAADGITVSAVALGSDADNALLEAIATSGRGRYYQTDDPRNIPVIFTADTLIVSRELFVEGEVAPQLQFSGELLRGLELKTFPPLAGYQRLFGKPTAQMLLATPDGEPLLASWRHGLGRSIAFASDLSSHWGEQWASWTHFTQLAGQMARWASRRNGGERMLSNFDVNGDVAALTLDVFDAEDAFVNGLELNARVADVQRREQQVALEQVAPGRYRGQFPVSDGGRYHINVSGDGSARTLGLAVPYSAEYLELGADRERLRALAGIAGGELLPMTGASIEHLFRPDDAPGATRSRLWQPLLLAALFLLVLEMAIRRVRRRATN